MMGLRREPPVHPFETFPYVLRWRPSTCLTGGFLDEWSLKFYALRFFLLNLGRPVLLLVVAASCEDSASLLPPA